MHHGIELGQGDVVPGFERDKAHMRGHWTWTARQWRPPSTKRILFASRLGLVSLGFMAWAARLPR